jgi:hypothetical protein
MTQTFRDKTLAYTPYLRGPCTKSRGLMLEVVVRF